MESPEGLDPGEKPLGRYVSWSLLKGHPLRL